MQAEALNSSKNRGIAEENHNVYSRVYYPVYSKPYSRLPMTTDIDRIESNVANTSAKGSFSS